MRDQAIYELLYSAGLRISECTDLDLTPGLDQMAAGWVYVMGKGQKARLAPIGSKAQQAIQAWLAIRHDYAKEDEHAVFVNQRGNRIGADALEQ